MNANMKAAEEHVFQDANDPAWIAAVASTGTAQHAIGTKLLVEESAAFVQQNGYFPPKWPVQEIPDADFVPDLSIPIPGEMARAWMASAFPRVLEFGSGKLDASRAKEIAVHLESKKNDSCQWTRHRLDVSVLSKQDKSRRISISWNGKSEEIDSLGISVVPFIRVVDGSLYIDCNAEITWIQNVDWPAWVLSAANEYCRSTVNPGMPRPVFSMPLEHAQIPPDVQIERGVVRIEGCRYPTSPDAPVNQTLFIDLKLAG